MSYGYVSKYDREVVRVFQIREHHAQIVKLGRYEIGQIKAGKNFKVTEPKFSNVTALNSLAKVYCIIVSADCTLQIYATICIF